MLSKAGLPTLQVLDATFDEILPLAVNRMPQSFSKSTSSYT